MIRKRLAVLALVACTPLLAGCMQTFDEVAEGSEGNRVRIETAAIQGMSGTYYEAVYAEMKGFGLLKPPINALVIRACEYESTTAGEKVGCADSARASGEGEPLINVGLNAAGNVAGASVNGLLANVFAKKSGPSVVIQNSNENDNTNVNENDNKNLVEANATNDTNVNVDVELYNQIKSGQKKGGLY